MKKILVVGAGFMGSGIAQVCAQAGFTVYLMDVNNEALDKALTGIKPRRTEVIIVEPAGDGLHVVARLIVN